MNIQIFKIKELNNDLVNKIETEALKYFYEHEFLTLEAIAPEDMGAATNRIIEYAITTKSALGDLVVVYDIPGSLMNHVYHLTGDNAYKDDCHLMVVDSSKFKNDSLIKAIVMSDFSEEGIRYFSDIVDNNAVREMKKCNNFYDNYISLYGDEYIKKLFTIDGDMKSIDHVKSIKQIREEVMYNYDYR